MPIDTPQELRDHIALAIQVELTTVPPYLYAMYSIADRSSEAALLIRSVVVEEMLHAALMANLLLAVGGEPRFTDPAWLPHYPGVLPHHVPELVVNLERCSPEVIRRVFMTIERPETHEAPPEPDDYESLGQFYHALELAVHRLDGEYDLFRAPQLERQLSDPTAYAAVEYDSDTSGGLHGIADVESACRAIETVIHQGEGVSEDRYADAEHRELTHYAKFCELADGTVPLGEILPAASNPTLAALPRSVRPVAELANALYTYTFVVLDRVFAPDTMDRGALVGPLYTAMTSLLGEVGRYLMTLEIGDGEHAGPPFAHRPFTDPAGPKAELLRLADAVTADHPALAPVAGVIREM